MLIALNILDLDETFSETLCNTRIRNRAERKILSTNP